MPIWRNAGKIVKDALGRILRCVTCPCTTAANCGNCTGTTERYQYRVTFAGSITGGTGCTTGDCSPLIDDFIVTQNYNGLGNCNYGYELLGGACSDWGIFLYLDDAYDPGEIWVAITDGSANARVEFYFAWTPPVDCGSASVTGGPYVINDAYGTPLCTFASLTCTVALV